MRAQSFPKRGALTVLHSVLLTDITDVGLEFLEVTVVHTREKVMLDLHVQPTGKEIHQIVVCSDIMRC